MNWRDWVRLWFSPHEPVGRREYVLSGGLLVVVKYLGDLLLMLAITGKPWLPQDYFGPIPSLIDGRFAAAPPVFLFVFALWTVPYLWIGVSMSMRRAADAGRSPWLALLFFVPVLSYVFIVAMSLLPSKLEDGELEQPDTRSRHTGSSSLSDRVLAVSAGVAVGIGMTVLTVYGLGSYGIPIFLGTPFFVGVIVGFILNRRVLVSQAETRWAVALTIAMIGVVMLAAAMEGVVCIVMAAPLALAIAVMGGVAGRSLTLSDAGRRPVMSAILVGMMLPASAIVSPDPAPTALREVRSSIEIDAPPAVVWRNVIEFPPLPEPNELVFRAGIAYPKRAEIKGRGVGAIRYCVFSTGAFVEPITRWEEGRRLSFDVASQPKPMQEWSPYADIAPPHLDGYFRSRRGEFRLVALPGNRTRLEGSTWYEMKLYPGWYWSLYGDALISRIHHRVLAHIKRQAETTTEH